MHKLLLFLILLSIISCKENTSELEIWNHKVESSKAVNVPEEKIDYLYQNRPLDVLKNHPAILDTQLFIKELKVNCHLYDVDNIRDKETINFSERIKIFGSNKFYYFLEYDFHDGSNAEFPWKYQFIFDSTGKLLKIFFCLRIKPLKIFRKDNPFLFGVSSTAHGNGGHEVYRINKDPLEQIYDGFIGYRPQTYSTGYDNTITEPNELNYKFFDVNKDGFNDIIFLGKVRYSKVDLGNEDKTIPVKYIFLYNKENGHFMEQEDYSKKYEFIYGDTK